MATSKEAEMKSIDELVRLPWSIELKPSPEGRFFARVVELPGCMTEGDTAAEALEALEETRNAWLKTALDQGVAIPIPVADTEYSGKIFVRTSPVLHRLVSEVAAREGVSMSQWVSEVLARATGHYEIGAWLSLPEGASDLQSLRNYLVHWPPPPVPEDAETGVNASSKRARRTRQKFK
jgi:antitoxin HicB